MPPRAARRAARAPLQYIAGSWAFMDLPLAVGLGVLGWLLHTQGKKLPAKCYALLYLGGFALTFFGTLALSLRRGELCWTLLQGNAPGVVLEAAGLFGLCLYGKPGARGRAVTGVKKSSQLVPCIFPYGLLVF